MIDVRPMAPAEHGEVGDLLREAYQPYTAHMAPVLYEAYLTGLLLIDTGQTLVALEGDKVVGTARLFAPGTAPVPLPPEWAWVRAVGVRPSAQGKGVGLALMEYCAAHASAPALALHTMDFMPSAVRLYERLGYRRAPEWDLQVGAKAGIPLDQTVTAIAYQLPLGPST